MFYSYFFIERMFWIFVRIALVRLFEQISKILVFEVLNNNVSA